MRTLKDLLEEYDTIYVTTTEENRGRFIGECEALGFKTGGSCIARTALDKGGNRAMNAGYFTQIGFDCLDPNVILPRGDFVRNGQLEACIDYQRLVDGEPDFIVPPKGDPALVEQTDEERDCELKLAVAYDRLLREDQQREQEAKYHQGQLEAQKRERIRAERLRAARGLVDGEVPATDKQATSPELHVIDDSRLTLTERTEQRIQQFEKAEGKSRFLMSPSMQPVFERRDILIEVNRLIDELRKEMLAEIEERIK